MNYLNVVATCFYRRRCSKQWAFTKEKNVYI